MKIALVNLSKFEKLNQAKNFKKDYNFLIKNNIDFIDYCFNYSEAKTLLKNFHQALKNPEVDLIWFARGGDKIVRFLDKIDWDLVKRANKKYLGFSDPTNFFFKALELGQTCYYGANLRRIGERFYSNKFNNRERKALINFLKEGQDPKYRHKDLFKKVNNLENEKIIGGHLVIGAFVLQRIKIDLSKCFLLVEYHLSTSDTLGELEFFLDQFKIAIKNNLPKGFIIAWSQVYDKNGKPLKQDLINKCFVDNLKEYNLPIAYINHIKTPIKLSLN